MLDEIHCLFVFVPNKYVYWILLANLWIQLLYFTVIEVGSGHWYTFCVICDFYETIFFFVLIFSIIFKVLFYAQHFWLFAPVTKDAVVTWWIELLSVIIFISEFAKMSHTIPHGERKILFMCKIYFYYDFIKTISKTTVGLSQW